MLGGNGDWVRTLDVEGEEPQPTTARHFRVELPQTARGGVTRICERLLAVGFAPLVQTREVVEREIGLAPNLQHRRPRGALETEWHVWDGAYVGGHVVAHGSVSPTGPDRQNSVLVRQIYRRAVDLEFELVSGGQDFRGNLCDAGLPRLQFAVVERVCQRQHRYAVTILGESGSRLGAHALGR